MKIRHSGGFPARFRSARAPGRVPPRAARSALPDDSPSRAISRWSANPSRSRGGLSNLIISSRNRFAARSSRRKRGQDLAWAAPGSRVSSKNNLARLSWSQTGCTSSRKRGTPVRNEIFDAAEQLSQGGHCPRHLLASPAAALCSNRWHWDSYFAKDREQAATGRQRPPATAARLCFREGGQSGHVVLHCPSNAFVGTASPSKAPLRGRPAPTVRRPTRRRKWSTVTAVCEPISSEARP